MKHFFPEPADASERALFARVNADGACGERKTGQGRTVTGFTCEAAAIAEGHGRRLVEIVNNPADNEPAL